MGRRQLYRGPIHCWEDCQRTLVGRGTEARIAPNTRLWVSLGGGRPVFRVRLHHTDILTYYPDGTFEFRSGGWVTATPRARLNQFGPRGWRFSIAGGQLTAFSYPSGGLLHEGERGRVATGD